MAHTIPGGAAQEHVQVTAADLIGSENKEDLPADLKTLERLGG